MSARHSRSQSLPHSVPSDRIMCTSSARGKGFKLLGADTGESKGVARGVSAGVAEGVSRGVPEGVENEERADMIDRVEVGD